MKLKNLLGGKKKDAPEELQRHEEQQGPSNNAPPQPHLSQQDPSQQGQQHYQQQQPQPQYGHPQQQYGVPAGYAVVPTLVPVTTLGPPRPTQVTQAIGWCCAAPEFDFPYVLSLADYLSTSATASKEAARALRKEFKHAVPIAQERAVRLTGILMRNTDLRFREQVASKKFLGELQDLANNKKTEPQVIEMVRRVLSPLAYEYQRDSELSPITALYNKIKPADWPTNGSPLDPSDPLLTPTLDPRNPHRQSRRPREPRRMPTASEQMKDLRREAEQARGNARLLSEAVAFAGQDDELGENEIVQEFHAKCFASQEFCAENIQWATAQAEQSRAALEADLGRSSSNGSDSQHRPAPSPPPANPHPLSNDATAGAGEANPHRNSPRLSSNNPFAPIVSGEQRMPPPAPRPARETDEEQTLAILLLAYSEITEALQAYDTHQQNQQEKREMAELLERSRNETRFDRSKAGTPDANGNYLSASSDAARGEGGSRPVSREHSPHRPISNTGDAYGGLGEVVSFQKASSQASRSPPAAADPFADRATSAASPTKSDSSANDRRQSRNPYAAFLNSSPATSPAKSTHAPSDNGFIIPDSFDSHRPLSPDGGRMLYEEPEENNAEERHDNGLGSLPTFGRGGSGASGSGAVYGAEGSGMPRRQGTDESEIATPSQPSDKALGKLRRLSVREGTESDPVEQQQKLEQALRSRYTEQYQEEESRRSGEYTRR